jgi:uncharacterized protein (TIGR02453 family)
MLQPSTIKFLKDLKKNNNKPWFDKNRKAYEAAKADFANFMQQVIDQYANKDPTIKNLLAKDCMFRINRDIRFSKDKSPYKTNFGASINAKGKSAWDNAGYYFHLEPGQCFAGGGMYMPPADVLKKVRQEIDYNFADLKKILAGKKFKVVYGGLDQSKEFLLSRVPKGYEPDNPAAEYLKLKSYIATVKLNDAELTSKNLVKKVTAAFEALQPLIYFINEAVKGSG